MNIYLKRLLTCLIFISCSTGKLDVLAEVSSSLEEVSAIEKTPASDIFWVIQDSGNKNHLYGLNLKGQIIRDIHIKNANNKDWEDLTSDGEGNIYIGDFGNNNEKRENFTIYKVTKPEKSKSTTEAEIISFKLPEDMDSADFEAFFLHKAFFYVFSKDHKKCEIIKIPNIPGNHVASYVAKIKLDGEHTKVTSADISDDGKTVILLNHDKLWKLTDFKNDNFFGGTIDKLKFDHDTQKEGITILNENQVLITDERSKHDGGYIYRFDFN